MRYTMFYCTKWYSNWLLRWIKKLRYEEIFVYLQVVHGNQKVGNHWIRQFAHFLCKSNFIWFMINTGVSRKLGLSSAVTTVNWNCSSSNIRQTTHIRRLFWYKQLEEYFDFICKTIFSAQSTHFIFLLLFLR